MRYAITIQYDGSKYHGWQRQPNTSETIEEKIENALEKVAGSKINVVGSGRTDEGVHALGQVAHFDSDKILPCNKYVLAINYYLPEDIRVIKCEEKPNDFDARKNAKKKTYTYRLYTAPVENPLRMGRETWCKSLDVKKMDSAVKCLIGEHDFSSFMTLGSSAKSPVRTIYNAEVKRDGSSTIFVITGNGFLYNMVRLITMVLIKIGEGGNSELLKEILEQRDRSKAMGLAPSNGLYLTSVEYD